MKIDFFVAVPNKTTGLEVAKRAEARGYECTVEHDGEKEKDKWEWTCYCSKMMFATYEGVVRAQAELAALASGLGKSDGWGTLGNADES